MLIYPYEDIRSLLAYKWTKQCVSQKWLEYDNLYKDLVRERAYEDGVAGEPELVTEIDDKWGDLFFWEG